MNKRGEAINTLHKSSSYAHNHDGVHLILRNRHARGGSMQRSKVLRAISPSPKGFVRSKSNCPTIAKDAKAESTGSINSTNYQYQNELCPVYTNQGSFQDGRNSIATDQIESLTTGRGGSNSWRRSNSLPPCKHDSPTKKNVSEYKQHEGTGTNCYHMTSSYSKGSTGYDCYEDSDTKIRQTRFSHDGSDALNLRGNKLDARGREKQRRFHSEESKRGSSLSQNSDSLRSGQNRRAPRTHQLSQSLTNSLPPSWLIFYNEDFDSDMDVHANLNQSPQDHGILTNPFTSTDDDGAMRSSKTMELHKNHPLSDSSKPPKSKSIIRMAVKHLGSSIKKMHKKPSREGSIATPVTESTGDTSFRTDDVPTSFLPNVSQQNLADSMMHSPKTFECFNFHNEEDNSITTSEKGFHESFKALNIKEADSFNYDQVYQSCEHPMFQTIMEKDDEYTHTCDINSALKNQQKMKQWPSVVVGKSFKGGLFGRHL